MNQATYNAAPIATSLCRFVAKEVPIREKTIEI
jgi:hypothetical protein